jgi:hypothetical protein
VVSVDKVANLCDIGIHLNQCIDLQHLRDSVHIAVPCAGAMDTGLDYSQNYKGESACKTF